MSAEVPRLIRQGQVEAARRSLDWYYDLFGKENFFFELQQHDVPDLEMVNRTLMELGPHYQARYVATNDAHYINPEDAKYQDILLAIQTGALLTDPDRMRMTDPSYYLRSPEEMQRLFAEVPESLSNTLLIAERCNVNLDVKDYRLPLFEVPEGQTTETYLRNLCDQGAKRRYGEKRQQRSSPDPPRLRTGRHPQDGLRRLLPDRLGSVPLRPPAGHLVQRARLGGRFDRRLHAGNHHGGPDPA